MHAATGNDYQKDRQFQKINSEKDSIDVAVVRGGKQLVVPNVDILVGDVMLLNTGDKVPCLLWRFRMYCNFVLDMQCCVMWSGYLGPFFACASCTRFKTIKSGPCQ